MELSRRLELDRERERERERERKRESEYFVRERPNDIMYSRYKINMYIIFHIREHIYIYRERERNNIF